MGKGSKERKRQTRVEKVRNDVKREGGRKERARWRKERRKGEERGEMLENVGKGRTRVYTWEKK